MDKIDWFIDRLSSLRPENCFNPYVDTCEVYDRHEAPEIRKSNLREILGSFNAASQIDIWVGRDLGYKGGRRTGLALTDEASLELYASHLRLNGLLRATNGPPAKERTASNIFRILAEVDVPVLTWNVFPLHPYTPGQPFSNRQHSRQEAEVGFTFLEELCSMFPVRRLVAIGNDAAKWANQLNVDVTKVRHPSYGGQTEFLDKMSALYSISLKDKTQLSLL